MRHLKYLWALSIPMFVASVYACGSSSKNKGTDFGLGDGDPCQTSSQCASNVCQGGVCVGNTPVGDNRPPGSACDSNTQCASGKCEGGKCAAGDNLPPLAACRDNSECVSGSCVNGVCTAGSGTGGSSGLDASTGMGGTGGDGTGMGGATGIGGSPPVTVVPCTTDAECASAHCQDGTCVPTTIGPRYPDSGTGFRPLIPGCGPDTADQCTGTCEAAGGDPTAVVVRDPATLCFSGAGDNTPDDPSVVIEQVIETINGVTYVHIRITFDPSFVDNRYCSGRGDTHCATSGANWPNPNNPHTFNMLVVSDHSELLLTNGSGDTVMHFKLDLISADPTSACGYSELGVTGGEGTVLIGDAACIAGTATSLDRNITDCGYAATAPADNPCWTKYSPTPEEAPLWDNRLVYELWVKADCFGDAGFGQGYVTYVHASPSKSVPTLDVTPSPCPPEWDKPYCPPTATGEGGNCLTPGTDGGTGVGGSPGTDGGTPPTGCPINWTVYVSSEGQSTCVPIPFANYPNMAACPTGYYLDPVSEGRYCLPIK